MIAKEAFVARWEAEIKEMHRAKARIAAEKKREKEALEAETRGFIASRRSIVLHSEETLPPRKSLLFLE